MGKEATRVRRRERKKITSGVADVNVSFNNTTTTISDAQGNAISWSSSGAMGFKGLAQVDFRCRLEMAARMRPARRRSTACTRWSVREGRDRREWVRAVGGRLLDHGDRGRDAEPQNAPGAQARGG